MQRRHKKTLECKGYQHQHLHQYPPDHHYNAPHLHQSPHDHGTLSVFTVEMGGDHLPSPGVSPCGSYSAKKGPDSGVEFEKDVSDGQEPEYEEIGEIVKDNKDDDNVNIRQLIKDANDIDKAGEIFKNMSEPVDDFSELAKESCEQTKTRENKSSVPVHNVTLASDDHPKHNIVYGMITAKEVAKYRPCTQNIILRPDIL